MNPFLQVFPRPFAIFLLDLGCWAKHLLCIIRRRHVKVHEIGHLTKPGFRGIPLRQCSFCHEILADLKDAAQFGASIDPVKKPGTVTKLPKGKKR